MPDPKEPLTIFQTGQLIISGIGASLTLMAVLVALFKDWFWSKIRKPILSVKFEMQTPYCTKTQVLNPMQQRPFDAFYFRLKFENTGSLSANRVQVYINKISRKNSDGRYHEDKKFQPMNLKWSNSLNNSSPEIYASHILPGMGKFCDLGHIFDPAFRQFYITTPGICIPGDSDVFLFELDLETQPFTGTHLLKIGEYEIEFIFAAENVKPINKKMILNFYGPWVLDDESMFSRGIGIRIL